MPDLSDLSTQGVRPGMAAHHDHDHPTSAVRAVLCFTCPGGLGQFRNAPDVLRRAAAYLEGDVWTPIPVAAGVYRLPS